MKNLNIRKGIENHQGVGIAKPRHNNVFTEYLTKIGSQKQIGVP